MKSQIASANNVRTDAERKIKRKTIFTLRQTGGHKKKCIGIYLQF